MSWHRGVAGLDVVPWFDGEQCRFYADGVRQCLCVCGGGVGCGRTSLSLRLYALVMCRRRPGQWCRSLTLCGEMLVEIGKWLRVTWGGPRPIHDGSGTIKSVT